MTSWDTTVSTLPRPMRWINASLSLSLTSATTCPESCMLLRLRITWRISASAWSGTMPVSEKTTTDLAVATDTLSRSPIISLEPCLNTIVVPFRSAFLMKRLSSFSICSLPSLHSTTMTPPPSDSFALMISLTNKSDFSVQPSMTVCSRSTTVDLPSRSACILACTASTTRPSIVEKYRMPMTTSVFATTRGTISTGAVVPEDSTPAHSLRWGA